MILSKYCYLLLEVKDRHSDAIYCLFKQVTLEQSREGEKALKVVAVSHAFSLWHSAQRIDT
jgi:hypothetical protein